MVAFLYRRKLYNVILFLVLLTRSYNSSSTIRWLPQSSKSRLGICCLEFTKGYKAPNYYDSERKKKKLRQEKQDMEKKQIERDLYGQVSPKR